MPRKLVFKLELITLTSLPKPGDGVKLAPSQFCKGIHPLDDKKAVTCTRIRLIFFNTERIFYSSSFLFRCVIDNSVSHSTMLDCSIFEQNR